MKRIVLLCFMLFLISCQPVKETPGSYNMIKVSIIKDSQELHIANIAINSGELSLTIVNQVREIEDLKFILENIKNKDLFLEYEIREGDKLILKRDLISPTDPRYSYVVMDELTLNGFEVDVK